MIDMSKLTVVGSSNTDMVVKTPRFPVPGETIIGGEFFMFPGGKGGNQAVAASRMGGDVSFITSLGDDIFGQNAMAGYKDEDIDMSGSIVHPNQASGVALITVNAEGENEIVVASGANNLLNVSHLEDCFDMLKSSPLILTQLETPLSVVSYLATFCREHNIPLVINPAPAQKLDSEILKGLYLITPNETETMILTGKEVSDEESAVEAAEKFMEMGVENVLITMGKRGAFFMNAKEQFMVAPPKVEAVDTTAAGDVFNGALVVFLSEGKSWKESIDLACKAAAVSVTRMGAQTSAPKRSEIANY